MRRFLCVLFAPALIAIFVLGWVCFVVGGRKDEVRPKVRRVWYRIAVCLDDR